PRDLPHAPGALGGGAAARPDDHPQVAEYQGQFRALEPGADVAGRGGRPHRADPVPGGARGQGPLLPGRAHAPALRGRPWSEGTVGGPGFRARRVGLERRARGPHRRLGRQGNGRAGGHRPRRRTGGTGRRRLTRHMHHGSGTPRPAAAGPDCARFRPLRRVHSSATPAPGTFSRAILLASSTRGSPLRDSSPEVPRPNLADMGAATGARAPASCPRTTPPMPRGASTYRSMGSLVAARISASWPSVASDGTLMVEAPSRSSWLTVSGLAGASMAETFQTTDPGSSPRRCISASSSSSPGSATRKPRIPYSTPRSTSSMAYLSLRAPLSSPARDAPSPAWARLPTAHSSRGPTNRDTSMPWSAPSCAISASSAMDSSMAPLPWETRLTVTSSAAAWSMTARNTPGPSTLGISIRK